MSVNVKRKSEIQHLAWMKWLGMLAAVMVFLWGAVVPVKAEDKRIQCGDNCYGILSDTGILTIRGTGDMWGYEGSYKSVFYEYASDVYKVVIENGITNIGDYTFSWFTHIQSVTIGNSVNTIGRKAFAYTSGLFSISIPGNVQTIEEYAFYESALSEVRFNTGLRTIGENAFTSTRISSVTLPDGLSSVEAYAFSNSSVVSVSVPKNITIIKSGAFVGRSVNATFASMDVIIGPNAFDNGSSFRVEHGSTAETYAKNYDLKLTYIQHPYTLTLNPCGGTISTKSRTILSDTYIGTLKNPTRKGYTFLGWYTSKSGGKKCEATTIMPAKNTIVYAHWSKIKLSRCSSPKVTNRATKKAYVTISSVKGAKGYEYAWSLKKNMKSAKYKRTTSRYLTIKNLKKNKVYYVRVRAYQIDSTKNRVYGKWSNVRAVRIKK